LFKRLVNLGAKSLACYLASTTHRQMSAEEQQRAGVAPEMIRAQHRDRTRGRSIADLDQALGRAVGPAKCRLSRTIIMTLAGTPDASSSVRCSLARGAFPQ